MTFRIPFYLPLIVFLLFSVPHVALVVSLVGDTEVLMMSPDALGAVLIPVVLLLVVSVALSVIKIPVVLTADGAQIAWVSELRWKDITGAKFGSMLGCSVLEISRSQGRPCRIWLRGCPGVAAFLIKSAPAGNPLASVKQPA